MAASLYSMAIKPLLTLPILTKQESNNTEDFVAQIDNVTAQHKNNEFSERAGIRKEHWKPNWYRNCCANAACNRAFNFTERHHHCRRCGDLFCTKCLAYRTPLNNMALPDINGNLEKVCETCHVDYPQEIGHTFNHTDAFYEFRYKFHSDNVSVSSKRSYGSGKSFNFDAELDRIKLGMRRHLENFAVLKAVNDLKSMLQTPQWLKSSRTCATKLQQSCTICSKDFTLLSQRNFCSICANSICPTCSSRDVIVYVNDVSSYDVQIAVIKLIGAPDKEPQQCFYFTVCINCKQELENRQLHKIEKDNFEMESGNWWLDFLNIRDKLKTAEAQISIYLPKYRDLIELLDNKRKELQGNSKKSNIQTLAKAQGDLNDHFSTFVLSVQKLKELRPITKSQNIVFSNFIRAKCDYYQENNYIFKQSRNKLAEIAPIETLNAIQDIVDRNAINSSFLSVTQLAYEILYLTSKYKLDESICQTMAALQDKMEHDLQFSITQMGENWPDHKKLTDIFIEQQLKVHRLIKPSRNDLRQFGAGHVIRLIFVRAKSILEQISMQLESKSAHRKFVESKKCLLFSLEKFVEFFNVRLGGDDGAKNENSGGGGGCSNNGDRDSIKYNKNNNINYVD